MTVYYVDPENGNNSNTGTSFATRWKSITSSNNSSLSAGDEVRIIKSPGFGNIGNGTWTGRPKGTGNSSISNTSATISKGTTTSISTGSTAHGLTTGDPITIFSDGGTLRAAGVMGLFEATVVDSTNFTIPLDTSSDSWSDGTSITVGVLWPKYGIVKMSSAKTQEIAFSCGLGRYDEWTTSTNVSISSYANNAPNGISGFYVQELEIGTSFTTGKAAYTTLPSALDLSAYQQISFRFSFYNHKEYDAGGDGSISVKLCSDTSGNTAVHTIDIPNFGGRTGIGSFPVTKDFGSALSTSIRSVAIYINTDQDDTFDMSIGQLIACKDSSLADAITMNSIITKESSETTTGESWEITFASGKFLGIGNGETYRPVTTNDEWQLYSGPSETVAAYHRRSLSTNNATVYGFYGNMLYIDRGSAFADNTCTISGGWDRTNMSTRDGLTCLAGSSIYSTLFASIRYTENLTIKHLQTFEFYHHYEGYGSASVHMENCLLSNNMYGNMDVPGASTYNNCIFMNETTFQYRYGDGSILTNCKFVSAGFASYDDSNTLYKDCTMRGDSYQGSSYSPQLNRYVNCSIDDLKSDIIRFNNNSGGGGEAHFINCTFSNMGTNDMVNYTNTVSSTKFDTARLTLTRYNNSATDHRTYWNYVTMVSETSVRHTASGIAWKVDIQSANYTAAVPFNFTLAEIFVTASSAVTATIWVRRTNTALTVKWGVLASDNTLLGVSSDVTDTASASADTWEQLSVTFTPTIEGVAKIKLIAYGGSTYSFYFDDFAITQI